MTEISSHAILYNESCYNVINQSRYLKPKDFGLSDATYRSTDPMSGFLYTLELAESKLYLEELSCFIGPPGGLLNKLKYTFRKYPPCINSIEPIIEENDWDEGRRQRYPCFVWYHQLSLPLRYTGSLTAVLSPNERLDIDSERPDTFTELLLLNFKKGKLKTVESVKGNARMPPPPVGPFSIEPSLGSIPKKSNGDL